MSRQHEGDVCYPGPAVPRLIILCADGVCAIRCASSRTHPVEDPAFFVEWEDPEEFWFRTHDAKDELRIKVYHGGDSGHVVTRFKGDTLIGTTRIPVDFLSLCVVCTDVLQCRSVPDIEMWSCKLSALHLQAMDPSTDKDGHHIPHSAGDLSAVPGLDPDPQHGATRDHRERKSPSAIGIMIAK
eukprot:57156-Rhodomonas_salina.1